MFIYNLYIFMPSFDVVSKIDLAEVDNAINGAMREISNRYDFKNSESKVSREDESVFLIAEDNYKIDQVQQIFRTHLVKRVYPLDILSFLKLKMQGEGCSNSFQRFYRNR